MTATRFTIKPWQLFGAGLLVVLALVYGVYAVGLGGPLVLDDFWVLQRLGEGGGVATLDEFLRFVFVNNSGPTGRPVAMLSFLIDARDWPVNIAALKYTNLQLHLLTGVAICWLALLLAARSQLRRPQAAALALIVAACWMLHPLNVSTTLYVVQRMTQLMSLFTVFALVCYLYGRQLVTTRPRRGLLLLCLALFPFGVLAALSKENGVLLLLYIIILEMTLLRTEAVNRYFRLWYRIAVLFPFSLVLLYFFASALDNLSLYETRPFGLLERILTEARVLCTYLGNIFLPYTVDGGVFHDDFTVSRGLLQPLTTLVSLLTLTLLFLAACYLRKREPVFSFAVFWFFAAHLLESTWLPLELYFEHRNYLAMVGPLYAGFWYLSVLMQRMSVPQARGLVLVLVAVLLVCVMFTRQHATRWGNAAEFYYTAATSKPASIRAQMSYADVLKFLREPAAAMERLQMAHRAYPQELTVLLAMWNLACESGLEAPYTLQQITSEPALEYYRDDINTHLEALLNNLLAQRCQFPDEAAMVSLFERIGEFPMRDSRRSGYHVYFADLYVGYRRLDPALINLSRAFELNPMPELRIRQAVVSAYANDFAYALDFLERAREADAARRPWLPSMEPEIARLEADFRRRIN